MDAFVSEEGKSCTSKSLNCGILPGSDKACSAAKLQLQCDLRVHVTIRVEVEKCFLVSELPYHIPKDVSLSY